MPIILWGSRGLTSTQGSGHFYCPKCDNPADYHLRQVREFFTLYFIPLFPIGSANRYVECATCGATFKEGVLDMEPPKGGEPQQVVNQLYEGLEEGMSIEETETRLMDLGMSRVQAKATIKEMTEGNVWGCKTCGEHYLKGVSKCSRCK